MSGSSRRTALITGATGGIGRAIVSRLVADGIGVWVTDVDAAACVELAEDMRARAGAAWSFTLDVGVEEHWQEIVQEIEGRSGKLDILVNNAGISKTTSTVADESLSDYERVVRVNQVGVFLGMKHAGTLIERSGGGAIVNVSSIFGTVGGLGGSFSYHAAKGAVRIMTKSAAVHWAERGVRVNAVCPGFIATPRLEHAWDGTERLKAILAGTPMKRRGRAEEVASAVAFLASEDAAFITGAELYVDGGWTAV